MHTIEGLVMPAAAAAKATSVHGAIPIPLKAASLAFVPMTDVLADALITSLQAPPGLAFVEFSRFSHSALLWVRELSMAAAVAYIETEYFGGKGMQAAAVWEAGQSALSPTKSEIGPINDALKRLGVVRTETEDEFLVAGLNLHRRNEDWLHV